MDSTTQYMLALLRASLNETTPNLPTIDTGEWERIYWLARKHGVVTMVNDAIEKLPSEQQPQGDIALSWTLSAERTRYHYALQTEVLQAIDQKAQAENLPYILLKGMTLAKLYPRPDSRPCGDIDICFPHNFERGNALLGDSNPHLDGKHAEIAIDGVPVENHKQLLDLNFKSQKKAEADIWNTLSTPSDDHTLCPMANMVYLLMHTVCHLTAKYKLALRNVLDWGLFLRANQETLNPDECHSVMKQIGMDNAFNMLTYLSAEFIGSDLSAFINGNLRQRDIDRMRELILSKQYFEAVPQNLPLFQYLLTRFKRNSQRRWLYRYLPASPSERLRNIIFNFSKRNTQ